jgi:hypothetical protein
MALNASAKGGSSMEPIEPGLYKATCYQVLDLGTHPGFKGKLQHKIMITWEIPELRIDVPEDSDSPHAGKDMPRVVGKEYTLSLSDRATLYKDLTSWRGKPFTDEELQAFDLFNVLGAPAG